MSMIAKPLYGLTEKEAKFDWTNECNEAFEILKDMSCSNLVLSVPTEEGTFEILTDA